MHKYTHIEYPAGCTREIINYIDKGQRSGAPRAEKPPKKTRKQMQDANMRQAARKLARKLNANYKPGDWHITLTYRKEARPTPEEARKILSDFIAELRKRYRQAGYILKWIAVTEYKKKHPHHHIVINEINAGKQQTTHRFVRELWSGRGNPKFVPLYDNGEYSRLAEYLIKETDETFRESKERGKQRYGCSRNLINPKPETDPRETKTLQEAGANGIRTPWRQEPKPRPGYYIDPDSLFNGLDKMGYPYQRYIMIKLNHIDNDWPSAELEKTPKSQKNERRKKTCRKHKRYTTAALKNSRKPEKRPGPGRARIIPREIT